MGEEKGVGKVAREGDEGTKGGMTHKGNEGGGRDVRCVCVCVRSPWTVIIELHIG